MSQRKLPMAKQVTEIKRGQVLKWLIKKADGIAHYQRLLESQLQPAARPHCKISYWREGEILLIVSDGQWATRLRYQQKRLQRDLAMLPEFAGLNRILFKVRPEAERVKKSAPGPVLSDMAVETIREAAEGITDDRLRSALERLSSHGRKSEQ